MRLGVPSYEYCEKCSEKTWHEHDGYAPFCVACADKAEEPEDGQERYNALYKAKKTYCQACGKDRPTVFVFTKDGMLCQEHKHQPPGFLGKKMIQLWKAMKNKPVFYILLLACWLYLDWLVIGFEGMVVTTGIAVIITGVLALIVFYLRSRDISAAERTKARIELNLDKKRQDDSLRRHDHCDHCYIEPGLSAEEVTARAERRRANG